MEIKQLLTVAIVLSVAALAQVTPQTTRSVAPTAQTPVVTRSLRVVRSASAGDVRTDYDRSIEFGRSPTYSWSTLQTGAPLSDQRVQAALDLELSERGWSLVPSGGNAAVAATVAATDHPTQRIFDDFGLRRQGFPYPTQYDYRVQTLTVYMFAASSEHLIWYGSASAILSGAPDRNTRDQIKGVRKMFEHFPWTVRSK